MRVRLAEDRTGRFAPIGWSKPDSEAAESYRRVSEKPPIAVAAAREDRGQKKTGAEKNRCRNKKCALSHGESAHSVF